MFCLGRDRRAPRPHDPDPSLPEDDGWDVNPAFERSPVAYVPG